MPPPVALILPARNEQEALGATLAEVAGLPLAQLIVVDNGSRDGTGAGCACWRCLRGIAGDAPGGQRFPEASGAASRQAAKSSGQYFAIGCPAGEPSGLLGGLQRRALEPVPNDGCRLPRPRKGFCRRR